MEQAKTTIEDETGRFDDQERQDMALKLGVTVIPTSITPIQESVRNEKVVEEITDPKTMSGDDYDLPWSD